MFIAKVFFSCGFSLSLFPCVCLILSMDFSFHVYLVFSFGFLLIVISMFCSSGFWCFCFLICMFMLSNTLILVQAFLGFHFYVHAVKHVQFSFCFLGVCFPFSATLSQCCIMLSYVCFLFVFTLMYIQTVSFAKSTAYFFKMNKIHTMKPNEHPNENPMKTHFDNEHIKMLRRMTLLVGCSSFIFCWPLWDGDGKRERERGFLMKKTVNENDKKWKSK